MIKPLKQLRYWLRFSTAFLKAHRRLIIYGAAASIVFAMLTPKVAQILSQRPGIKRVGLVGKNAVDTLPRVVLDQISHGLTSINQDGSFAPNLAKKWEINQENTEYIFHLNPGYMWHDKTSLLSNQLVYNFTDVSVVHPDPMTIIFKLKEPFAPFPGVVSWPVFKKGLTGLGEQRVQSIKRNGMTVQELTLYSPSTHQKTIYRFYPTQKAAITAFKLGEIDELETVAEPSQLETWPNVNFTARADENKVVLLLFNLDHSLLTERNFRQGLAYAIKKKWPARSLGPISPRSWAYNPGLKTYDYNLEKARELLKDAIPEGEQPKLVLSTFSSLYSTAEEIGKDWGEVGIETELKTSDQIPNDFQVLLLVQETPPDPDQYALWHSTQPSNLSHLRSPQIDKLLEEGRQTIEFDKRKDLYFDFQRFLVEETPAVFLYHPQIYTLSRG